MKNKIRQRETTSLLSALFPGADKPYFELSLQTIESIQEKPQPVKALN